MGQYEINTPNPYSIMQANALYAYCGNSPVRLLDWYGYYYIVANYKTTFNSYGLPTSNEPTGTYTLQPETWLTSTSKSASDFIPWGLGSVLTKAFEYASGVAGGNSQTGIKNTLQNIASNAPEEVIEKIVLKLFGETANKVASNFFNLQTIYKNLTKDQTILTYDTIAFELLNRNSISLTSKSIDELNSIMEKTYLFIDSLSDYFIVKIDGNTTLFEIDNHLNDDAWWPEWDKSNYVSTYSYNLTDLIHNNPEHFNLLAQQTQMVEDYSNLLDDYENRYQCIDEMFIEYMNS